ncbi:MAG: response regulator [Phycisphaerae bacterium]|nr:response regulator [Gemmatimonadaceae bacterium]
MTADGREATVQAFVNKYDAIILDVMLPGKDGRTVIRELRARHVPTPVLMLTARDSYGPVSCAATGAACSGVVACAGVRPLCACGPE